MFSDDYAHFMRQNWGIQAVCDRLRIGGYDVFGVLEGVRVLVGCGWSLCLIFFARYPH